MTKLTDYYYIFQIPLKDWLPWLRGIEPAPMITHKSYGKAFVTLCGRPIKYMDINRPAPGEDIDQRRYKAACKKCKKIGEIERLTRLAKLKQELIKEWRKLPHCWGFGYSTGG